MKKLKPNSLSKTVSAIAEDVFIIADDERNGIMKGTASVDLLANLASVILIAGGAKVPQIQWVLIFVSIMEAAKIMVSSLSKAFTEEKKGVKNSKDDILSKVMTRLSSDTIMKDNLNNSYWHVNEIGDIPTFLDVLKYLGVDIMISELDSESANEFERSSREIAILLDLLNEKKNLLYEAELELIARRVAKLTADLLTFVNANLNLNPTKVGFNEDSNVQRSMMRDIASVLSSDMVPIIKSLIRPKDANVLSDSTHLNRFVVCYSPTNSMVEALATITLLKNQNQQITSEMLSAFSSESVTNAYRMSGKFGEQSTEILKYKDGRVMGVINEKVLSQILTLTNRSKSLNSTGKHNNI